MEANMQGMIKTKSCLCYWRNSLLGDENGKGALKKKDLKSFLNRGEALTFAIGYFE